MDVSGTLVSSEVIMLPTGMFLCMSNVMFMCNVPYLLECLCAMFLIYRNVYVLIYWNGSV
jgi:hypothetical protein